MHANDVEAVPVYRRRDLAKGVGVHLAAHVPIAIRFLDGPSMKHCAAVLTAGFAV